MKEKLSILRAVTFRTRKDMASVYGCPTGECYRWSMNLASNLADAGLGEVWIVCGEIKIPRHQPNPHSWLEYERWVLDITADQFLSPSGRPLPAVLICRKSAAKFHMGILRRAVRHHWLA